MSPIEPRSGLFISKYPEPNQIAITKNTNNGSIIFFIYVPLRITTKLTREEPRSGDESGGAHC